MNANIWIMKNCKWSFGAKVLALPPLKLKILRFCLLQKTQLPTKCDGFEIPFFLLVRKGTLSQNVGPLLNEIGDPVTEDTNKVELRNAIFASSITAKAVPQLLEVRLSLSHKGLG